MKEIQERVQVQIVSDLHIEQDKNIPSALDFITPSAPILILAGDIGKIYELEKLKKFLTDICSHFQAVLYVLGNHEYYRISKAKEIGMEEIVAKFKKLEEEIPNLYILNRTGIQINDVCFVGCTLWSNAKTFIPHYIVRIKGMGKHRYNFLHSEDVAYIKETIGYCRENNKKLCVITHHAPSLSLLGDNHEKDEYSSLYASDLDYLCQKENVHTWVYGHTHHNRDILSKGGTRLVSNQRGKPKDNIQDFDKAKVIEI